MAQFEYSKNPNAKLKESDVILMRELKRQGWINKDIAVLFPNMNEYSIKTITGNRSWKHVQ